MFNLSLGNVQSSNSSRGSGQSSSKVTYGRVVEVILNENHPYYAAKGGSIAINGVFYKPLSSNIPQGDINELPFAYQASSHVKTVPLVGETVKIDPQPVPSGKDFSGKTRKFYTGTVNIWNSANSNVYPDLNSDSELDLSQEGNFKELPTVSPIGSSPGDIQIEGRQGQSIRFTGGRSKSTPWVDSENIGKPLIIISNGQSDTDEGFTTISEDVNEDASSIYLTSDHKIPIELANEKRDCYDEVPELPKEYKGNQVIINGGRLVFNAKEKDILLSSKESIGLNTGGSINIDSTNYFCVDSNRIYLGANARTANERIKEPIVMGHQLEGFLLNVLTLLEGMANDMAGARTIKNHPIPRLNKRGLQAMPVIKALKGRLNPNGPSSLKSKKVFTE